jgi:hypothetical protein
LYKKVVLGEKVSGKVDKKPIPVQPFKVSETEFMQGQCPPLIQAFFKKKPAHPQDNRPAQPQSGRRLFASVEPSALLGEFPRQTFSRVKLFKCLETIGDTDS